MNDITVRRPVEWICSSATNPGAVRPINEDAILERQEISLWAVADGMGGHEAGNVASQMIIETLKEMVRPSSFSAYVDELENRIMDVNQRLLEYSEIMLDGRVVGSTFVGFTIFEQVGLCLWVGDSRLYLYRGNELKQLSRDHSQVAELIASGAISEAEAVDHPDANVITRAVGTGEELFVDYEVFPVQIGDVFLLCSDGLYNAVDTDNIAALLQADSPGGTVEALIEQALKNEARDNVSVIVVKGVRRQTPQAVQSASDEL